MSHELEKSPRTAGITQGAVIILASILPVMGVVLISPIAPLLKAAFENQPGGSYLAAAALTAPALAVAVCSPMVGALIDRIGARRMLITALLAYALIGIAPLWLDSLPTLIIARLALGIAEAVILTANLALLAGYFEGQRRSRWIAYQTSAAALGATGLYILGGVLGQVGWRAPFAAYGVSGLIALAAAIALFEPSRTVAVRSYSPARRLGIMTLVNVLVLCVVTVLSAVMFYVIPIQFAVLLAEVGVKSSAQFGFLIAIAGLGNPVGAFAFRFVSRIPTSLIMGVAGGVAAIGLGLVAIADALPLVVAGAFINQIGCGIFVPAMAAATMQALPPERRGIGGGSWVTSFFSGQFLSPLFVELMINTAHGVRGGFVYLALATLVVGIAAAAVLVLVGRSSIARQWSVPDGTTVTAQIIMAPNSQKRDRALRTSSESR
ncbi:MFS transporter [Bradyrhizobium erythrophlei]|uniref:Predicted arabinose efflux permease, MFS family n=1 Tax=Bradyrhizobium erythrophlei TaxID=1437360 RepID=A0A1H4Z1D1_9BRAD|nr:MFS transporter [Bradyrhizobium erythrophlei]SED23695.1 Predicted arabinose efflux permease, MFS family [Bradyrhizobium erythrophlei]